MTAQTEAQWARDVEARLAKLERGTVTRIGDWSLSQDAEGNLIAEHSSGARRIVSTH